MNCWKMNNSQGNGNFRPIGVSAAQFVNIGNVSQRPSAVGQSLRGIGV